VEVPVFAVSGVAVFVTMAKRPARSENDKQVIDGTIPIMATRRLPFRPRLSRKASGITPKNKAAPISRGGFEFVW